MEEPLRIDVVTDVVCPWCFIGVERLEHVLERFDHPVELVHHPFLLQPATPPEGVDIPAMLRAKYGTDPRALFERAEAAARESGIDLDLSKQRYSYPSLRAHTLIRHAGERGTQRALAREFFRANFQDARNVNDPDTLAEIGGRHGFTAEEVHQLVSDEGELARTRADAEGAARRGIRGVPFFVFQNRAAVSGAQPEDVFKGLLERALAGDL